MKKRNKNFFRPALPGRAFILPVIAAGIFFCTPSGANGKFPVKRFAVTDFSVTSLREKPDFPSELGNQLLMGTPVEIIDTAGYWRLVASPEPYRAWCVDMSLAEMDSTELAAYISAPKFIFTDWHGHLYERPDVNSGRISDLVTGDLLCAIKPSADGTTDGKGHPQKRRRTDGRKGKFIKVWLPSGSAGYVLKKNVEVFSDWAANTEASAAGIISAAEKFLGVPYLWGGTSVKGVDCSGFTRMVFFLNGVLLPRNASRQAMSGKEIPVEISRSALSSGGELPEPQMKEEMLRRIALLEPGDLIFFGTKEKDGPGEEERDRITHVGIYVGNGRFIHASRIVRRGSLIPGDEDYYELSYKMIAARRVIGEEDKGTGIIRILHSPAYFPRDNQPRQD